MSTIYLDNGIKITTYPRPPVELDPMTASREELVRAGMPARPTRPDALACYERFFTSTKDRFHYIEPTFKPMPGPPGHAPITADMAESTNNWSGVSVRATDEDWIKSVSAQWEVPDVIMTGDEGTSWENAASWIGIDGTPDGGEFVPLRAGVVSTITEDGTTAFFGFAGWDPAAGAQITNLEVKAKDTVIVSICSANGPYSQSATIHFAIQHGAATSFQLSAPSGSVLLGANAEFVVTKQNLSGIPVGFPNYGSVRFKTRRPSRSVTKRCLHKTETLSIWWLAAGRCRRVWGCPITSSSAPTSHDRTGRSIFSHAPPPAAGNPLSYRQQVKAIGTYFTGIETLRDAGGPLTRPVRGCTAGIFRSRTGRR